MSFQMVLLPFEDGGHAMACFGTMSFQMVLLQRCHPQPGRQGFGTMSFQMVLLPSDANGNAKVCFGTMSFQMVLLRN